MEATARLLSEEQASNRQLRGSSEELAAELGGVKRSLDETAAALASEQGVNQELRAQLESIKSEYIAAGE